MKKAHGINGSWYATVEPGTEKLPCIHKRFYKYTKKCGIYLEPFDVYTKTPNLEKVKNFIEDINKIKKVILTTDKATVKENGKIDSIPRDEYIGIYDVCDAMLIDESIIFIKMGQMIERLQ